MATIPEAASTDDLQQRLAAAHQTIACLHAQADAQAHTAYQVAERLRQELATRNSQLAELEQQLTTAEVQHAGQLQQLEEAQATALAHALETTASEEQQHKQRIADLEHQLHELRSFAQEREVVHARMTDLQQQCEALRADMAEQAHATEAARLSSEAALRRAHEEAIAAVRQEAEATTAQRLDALVKRIVRDSETLKAEVALHTQATAQLQQELQAAQTTCASLEREGQLFEEREHAYAARTAALVKQLEDRAAAIATLEQSLAALVAEFEGQRRAAAAAHEAELQAASRDVDALRRLAQLQAGQLSKARQVARAALRVRTCVERFLHASIQTVAFMPAGAPVQAGDATEAVEALCTGDMDVADMPWPLRESVLRLLFAHIRGHVMVPALAHAEAERPHDPPPPPSTHLQETAQMGAPVQPQEPLDVLSGVGGLPDLC